MRQQLQTEQHLIFGCEYFADDLGVKLKGHFQNLVAKLAAAQSNIQDVQAQFQQTCSISFAALNLCLQVEWKLQMLCTSRLPEQKVPTPR